MSDTSDQNARLQFRIHSLLLGTTVVAWTLAVNRSLGDVHGWRTALPCGIVAAFLLLVDCRTAIGGALGSVTLAVVGYAYVLDLNPLPRFFHAMLIFLAFGGAVGCSINAIILSYWRRGTIALLFSIVGFFTILYIN